ncbi:MAG: NUDIX domain-containing protein [Haloarculaceae archaeon]
MGENRIPADDWATVVRSVPIVSVDLVVLVGDGVVLGKRTNEPAKGEWFVPGGRVHKHERLDEAVHRIAREELDTDVTIERQLGVYGHFYDTADVPDADGKHYVPIGYLVSAEKVTAGDLQADDQHADLRLFDPPFDDLDLHPYVEQYLDDAGIQEASVPLSDEEKDAYLDSGFDSGTETDESHDETVYGDLGQELREEDQ